MKRTQQNDLPNLQKDWQVFLFELIFQWETYTISYIKKRPPGQGYFFGGYMKYIIQFSYLLGFWLLGELLSLIMKPIFYIPGSIVGMLIFFAALTLGFIKESQIKEVADFMLENIAFFFLPATVSIMALSGIARSEIFPLVIITFVSTMVTMIGTMFLTHYLTQRRRAKKNQ